MTVELVALCDAASVKGGQICILHTFANCTTGQLPVRVRGVLIASVRMMDDESGDHRLYWVMVDNDGKEVWRSEWAVGTVKLDPGQLTQLVQSMWHLNAELFAAGQHELTLYIDEKPVTSLMLHLKLL